MFLTWFTANAATWTVDPAGGGDFTTVAAAVAGAASGDTIEVGPGTYTDALAIGAVDLTLHATDGAATTMLSEGAGQALLTVDGGHLVLDGFDVSAGRQCIRVKTGGIEIRNAVIHDCAGVSLGGGLRLDVGTTAVVEATEFRADTTAGDGGNRGAAIYSRADHLEIRDSSFVGCTSSGDAGAVVIVVGDNLIERTTFEGNVSGQRGGAILVEGAARTFDDGVVGTGVTSMVITDSRFVGNQAVLGGGAIWAQEAPGLQLTNNLFCANHGGDEGGALRVAATGGPVSLSRNIVQENDADHGGGAFFLDGEVTLDGDDWLANAGPSFGGGVGAQNAAVSATHEVFAWSDGWGLAVRSEGTFTGDWNAWFGNAPEDFKGADPGLSDVFTDPLLGGVSLDGDCTNDDWTPGEGSPLVDAGDPAQTDEDGTTRDIGAVFRPAPPPEDTGTPSTTDADEGGCGCAHPGSSTVAWPWLGAALLLRRRAQRPSSRPARTAHSASPTEALVPLAASDHQPPFRTSNARR